MVSMSVVCKGCLAGGGAPAAAAADKEELGKLSRVVVVEDADVVAAVAADGDAVGNKSSVLIKLPPESLPPPVLDMVATAGGATAVRWELRRRDGDGLYCKVAATWS